MKNFYNLGFIALILVVLGCNCSNLDEFTKSKDSTPLPTLGSTPDTSSSPATRPSETQGSALNKEKYRQIKKGMARADIEKLLGGSGEEMSSSSGGGHTYTVVKWADRSAYIVLTFDNDKVWTMAQGGLK